MPVSRTAMLVCVVLALAGTGAWLLWERWGSPPADKVWRIGCEQSDPVQKILPDGTCVGAAIDTLSEAARRNNIRLAWTPVTTGPDKALMSGAVDLWPLIGRHPARKGKIHISDPWMRTPFRLISLTEHPVRSLNQLEGMEVGVPAGPLSKLVLATTGGKARVRSIQSMKGVLRSLCAGELKVILLPQDSVTPEAIDNEPSCAGRKFHAVAPSTWLIEFGVGASYESPGATRVADQLHQEIVRMGVDGALTAIAMNWRLIGGETRLLDDFTSARRHRWYLTILSLVLAGTIALLVWYEFRLRRARLAAESAARAKSQFLANMSHEIRTPLHGVLGMTSLLLASDLEPGHAESVRTIHGSGEALLRILDDVLDLAKIEAGKFSLNPAPFRVRTLLEDSVALFTPRAREKGLSLSFDLAPDVPEYLNGDAVRIGQVLHNLIGNALKFTEYGTVRLRASWEREADPPCLLIEVADTGPGIPQGAQADVFQKFSQIQAGPGRQGGTGLGLAICRQLVELMAGQISVESRLGNGSRFRVALPLPVAETPAKPPVDHASTGRAINGVPKVLVAEDNEVNQLVARRLLERLGCEVTVASDGEQALQIARARFFDLLLLDCHMPGLDGLEVARRLRAESPPDSLPPMIAFSASAMQEEKELCRAAGMDDFLPKPADLHALSALLSKWIPSGVSPAAQ